MTADALQSSADLHKRARRDADQCAARAGVEVTTVGAKDAAPAAELLGRMWGSPVVEAPLMVALAHSGNYVAVAKVDEVIVGACVGYFSQPLGRALHSHVTGVDPHTVRRGIGLALKLHQRAWALDRGLTHVTWTFDPLVARNATFNVRRLGASVADYLADFYGDMTDGVNRGQESDRLLASWDLSREVVASGPPQVQAALAGASALVTRGDGNHPVSVARDPRATTVTVAVPADIDQLRREDPDAAREWRVAVRDAVMPALRAGWIVTDFTDDHYVLEAPHAD